MALQEPPGGVARQGREPRANELDPENAGTLNFLGWIRATCPQDDLRDAEQAIRDAVRACQLTDYGMPGFLDTLAAAYAEAGQFEEAVRWQEQAIGLAPDDQKADYESRKVKYERGEPHRDTGEEPEA